MHGRPIVQCAYLSLHSEHESSGLHQNDKTMRTYCSRTLQLTIRPFSWWNQNNLPKEKFAHHSECFIIADVPMGTYYSHSLMISFVYPAILAVILFSVTFLFPTLSLDGSSKEKYKLCVK